MLGRGGSLLVVLVLLCVACSAPVRYYECGFDGEASPGIQQVWNCNRNVMQRIVKGKRYSLREFWAAAEFFEQLTGTPADVVQHNPGPLPGPRLPDNLRAWDHWYVENRDRLVWDPATSSIRLADDGRS